MVIVGCPNVNPGSKLAHNRAYPRIPEDHERMWRVLESLPCDILLGAHGSYFGMEETFFPAGLCSRFAMARATRGVKVESVRFNSVCRAR